jgi:hypothetical protein
MLRGGCGSIIERSRGGARLATIRSPLGVPPRAIPSSSGGGGGSSSFLAGAASTGGVETELLPAGCLLPPLLPPRPPLPLILPRTLRHDHERRFLPDANGEESGGGGGMVVSLAVDRAGESATGAEADGAGGGSSCGGGGRNKGLPEASVVGSLVRSANAAAVDDAVGCAGLGEPADPFVVAEGALAAIMAAQALRSDAGSAPMGMGWSKSFRR